MICDTSRLSPAAADFAVWLDLHRIGAGDALVIWLDHSSARVAVTSACRQLGIGIICLDDQMAFGRIAHLVSTSGASAMVSTQRRIERLRQSNVVFDGPIVSADPCAGAETFAHARFEGRLEWLAEAP